MPSFGKYLSGIVSAALISSCSSFGGYSAGDLKLKIGEREPIVIKDYSGLSHRTYSLEDGADSYLAISIALMKGSVRFKGNSVDFPNSDIPELEKNKIYDIESIIKSADVNRDDKITLKEAKNIAELLIAKIRR